MNYRGGAGSHWAELYHSSLVRRCDPEERPTLLTMELWGRNRPGPVPGNRQHFWCETYNIYALTAPRLEGLQSKDSCAPCHSVRHALRGLGGTLVQRNFPCLLSVEMVFYGSFSREHRSSLQIPVCASRASFVVHSHGISSLFSQLWCSVNKSPFMCQHRFPLQIKHFF